MSEIPDLPPVLERLLRAGHHEQIGAYALDSLPAEERIAFEAHLRDCEQCQAELPVLLNAAAVLQVTIVPEKRPPSAATPTVPRLPVEVNVAPIESEERVVDEASSAELESESAEAPAIETASDDSVVELLDVEPMVDSVDATDEGVEVVEPAAPAESIDPSVSSLLDELPPIDEHLLVGDETAEVVAGASVESASSRIRSKKKSAPAPDAATLEAPVPSLSPVPALPQPKPQKPSKLPWILGGLGLLFGIASIIAALALAETKGNLEEEIAFQNSQIDELNAERDAYLQQTTAITWTLEPTTLGTPGSGGTVFADPAGTSTILSVFGMAPLGSDQMYQVWYVLPDTSSVAGPALTLDSSGGALVQLETDLSQYQAIAITIEPASGSELPSTNPVLQGFFTSS